MMMQGAPTPDVLDQMNGRIPPSLKFILAAAGAAGGWWYSRQYQPYAPMVCIAWGALLGFFFWFLLFSLGKVVKFALYTAIFLAALNYAVLIPLGYRDQMPMWSFQVQAFVRRDLPRLLPFLSNRKEGNHAESHAGNLYRGAGAADGKSR